MSEWCKNKTNFCYWMQFYDAIYSFDDCPEDYVIEDNELLDKWYEGKIKEIDDMRKGKRKEKKGLSGGKNAFSHQAVTVY